MRQNGLAVFFLSLLTAYFSLAPVRTLASEPPERTPPGESRMLRYPDIHENLVVFSHGGDLWTVPLDGGRAVRITTHPGLEISPRFSPDGKWIAFTGEYDGNRDVYVIPAGGGEPRRLTWRQARYGEMRHGYDNHVLGWIPDGEKVLFRSWRLSFDGWFERLFTVAADGSSAPEALELPEAGLTDFSPDGKMIAYNREFRNFRTWKRYYGGLAQDIWTWDFEAKKSERLTDWKGTDTEPVWLGEKIYYNSDQSGRFNVWEMNPDGSGKRQLTYHEKWDARWMSGGPGGLVYQLGGYLYHLDPAAGGTPRRIPVLAGNDDIPVRPAWRQVSDLISSYNLSTTGRRAVFEARGDLYTVPAQHGEVRKLTSGSGSRERAPVWSPDGKWILYLSDETDEDELYLIEPGPTTGVPRKKVQLTRDGKVWRYDPVWSPNSRLVAFSDKDLRLWILDVETRALTLADSAEIWEITRYSFSPDSRWLAYSKPVQRDRAFSSIFLYNIPGKTVHEVTGGFTNDTDPVFDPNGRYLYFVSGRDFSPKLGNFEMSYVYENMDRVYLLTLQADSLSPLHPRSDEETAAGEGKDVGGKSKAADGDKKEAPGLRIDLDGLGSRIVTLAEKPGNYGGLRSSEGRVFWLSAEQGRPGLTLFRYDVSDRKQVTLAEGINGYDISPDGKKLIVRKGGSFHIVDAAAPKPDLSGGALDLSGMRTRVDYRAEWRQMFNEAWRQLRDFFYVPNMHGVDWAAVRDQYAPLVEAASHRDDLNFILGEMVGDLAAGHTYVGGGDYPEVKRTRSALLAAELEPHNGFWRIGHILPGENWQQGRRSPLTEPGVNVSVGDYLLAVDGEPLTAPANPWAAFEGKAGRTLALTVGKSTDISQAATYLVKPVDDEMPQRYLEWVENNRARVLDMSGGRVGYLHIPDMGFDGLSEFVKRYYAQIGMEGLVIDVRYNGGGFVSQMIIERLRRELGGMDAPRNALPGTYPRAVFTGPMACVINRYSASDGDIFPWMFRRFGLGPLVGTRTWGGVVGIRGYSTLVDGGYITRPEFGTYGVDSEWIIENQGVSPDHEVDNLPEDVIAGRDPQLARAVELILEQLGSRPSGLPPRPEPDRR